MTEECTTGASPLFDFIKFLRPHFLVGGLMMNIFGSALASYSGRPIDLTTFLLVQMVISSVQLAGQTANEYADAEGDALNKNRTFFSGGSGMLSGGRISKRTAMVVTVIIASVALAASALLFSQARGDLLMLSLIAVSFFLAIEYSIKPLRLESSGTGEAAMAVTVGFFSPSVAFIAQGGSDYDIVSMLMAVTVLTTFCLLVTIEYPDYEPDRASGKDNLLVRFGRDRSFMLGISALLIAAALSADSVLSNVPAIVGAALFVIIVADSIALIAIKINLISMGKGFGLLTAVSIGMYALAIGLASLFLLI
jgi:1,4-dihydroxy-2-naphthoate polyprenyltransferase